MSYPNSTSVSSDDFESHYKELIAKVQDSQQTLLVTIEGRPAVVVQSAEQYEQTQQLLEESELVRGVRQGLESINAGNTVTLNAFDAEMRSKYPELDALHRSP